MNIIQQYPDIINYAMLIAVLVYGFRKFKVNTILDKLKDDIKNYVDASENEKNKSVSELKEINEKIEKLPLEIKDLEQSADSNIKGIESKIKREVNINKKNLENNADRLLKLETKNFKQKLTSMLAKASVKLAQDNAIEQLKNNSELHNQYIKQAIDELDRIEL